MQREKQSSVGALLVIPQFPSGGVYYSGLETLLGKVLRANVHRIIPHCPDTLSFEQIVELHLWLRHETDNRAELVAGILDQPQEVVGELADALRIQGYSQAFVRLPQTGDSLDLAQAQAYLEIVSKHGFTVALDEVTSTVDGLSIPQLYNNLWRAKLIAGVRLSRDASGIIALMVEDLPVYVGNETKMCDVWSRHSSRIAGVIGFAANVNAFHVIGIVRGLDQGRYGEAASLARQYFHLLDFPTDYDARFGVAKHMGDGSEAHAMFLPRNLQRATG